MSPRPARLPSLYITHGAGPCFWADLPPPFGPGAFEGLKNYLAGILPGLPARPTAILIVSAHWEEESPTISVSAHPPMLYDYDGFPAHTYHLSYPAPGSPDLGERVGSLLKKAGIASSTDATRGFDHGVFVPLLIMDPKAEIPVVMLSLRHDLDPARHFAIGAALATLRDEGVLIIGSGSSYHNLRSFFDGQDDASKSFDAWLLTSITSTDPDHRKTRLLNWEQAPSARACHPREEHLMPLLVAAGAAGPDHGMRSFHDIIAGKTISCFAFGAPEIGRKSH